MLSSGWLRYPSSEGDVPLGHRMTFGFPNAAMYSAAEMNSFSDPMWKLRLRNLHHGVTLGDRTSDRTQQGVVKRVPGADLEHVHARVEGQLHLLFVHDLGVDRQAGEPRGLHQDLDRFAVALEGIGIRPRLPDSAPQDMGAGLLHGRGRLQEIPRVLRVDRALPGDDEEILPQGNTADGDPVARQVRPPVHELEGRLDPVDALDVRESLQPVDHQFSRASSPTMA